MVHIINALEEADKENVMLVEIKKDEDKNKIIELTFRIAKLEYFCNELNNENKNLLSLVNELINRNNIYHH